MEPSEGTDTPEQRELAIALGALAEKQRYQVELLTRVKVLQDNERTANSMLIDAIGSLQYAAAQKVATGNEDDSAVAAARKVHSGAFASLEAAQLELEAGKSVVKRTEDEIEALDWRVKQAAAAVAVLINRDVEQRALKAAAELGEALARSKALCRFARAQVQVKDSTLEPIAPFGSGVASPFSKRVDELLAHRTDEPIAYTIDSMLTAKLTPQV